MGILKKLVKKIWANRFFWNIVGCYFRRPGVVVLMYHRVGDKDSLFPSQDMENFRAQMLWIKNNCNAIAPGKFQWAVNQPRSSKPYVLVTFDDGYRCCYEQAYPVLEALSIPAIVFLATQPPDEGGLIWTEQVFWAVYQSSKTEVYLPWEKDEKLKLTTKEDKKNIVTRAKNHLKKQSNKHRLELLKLFYENLGVTDQPELERQMLSWQEVRDSSNLITYGGHTHTHPIMSSIDTQQLEHEIKYCRDRIAEETGIMPKYFAYPNGSTEDYNDNSIRVLDKYGFELAFTTNEGINYRQTNLMEIKRIPTGADNIEDFVWLLSRATG